MSITEQKTKYRYKTIEVGAKKTNLNVTPF